MEQQLAEIESRLKICPISINEAKEIILKAERDALYAFYKSLFQRQYVSDFMSEGILPHDHANEDQMEVIRRARDMVVSKPPFALITVNPYKQITLDELTKYVLKFVDRKIIDNYMYVYEVRKSDMSGLHCHMLVKYNCKPYDLKRNLKSTFKNICDESNPHILNIKYISDDILPSKIEYLKGNKKDAKKEGVLATIKYRTENGLCPVYNSTPPISCRGTEETLLIENLSVSEGAGGAASEHSERQRPPDPLSALGCEAS